MPPDVQVTEVSVSRGLRDEALESWAPEEGEDDGVAIERHSRSNARGFGLGRALTRVWLSMGWRGRGVEGGSVDSVFGGQSHAIGVASLAKSRAGWQGKGDEAQSSHVHNPIHLLQRAGNAQ